MRALLLLATLAFACSGQAQAREASSITPTTVPASGVIGVDETYLSPEFWIARQPDADRLVMDRAAIDAQNEKLLRLDRSMHDLDAIPATLERAQVARWIDQLSQRPTEALFDEVGTAIPATTLDAVIANLDLDAIAQQQPTRYGLVVERAALRTFPTELRVFSEQGDTDIDRFQESALFPGTPVVIAHASHDGRWWFVVSPRYAAWIEARHVAVGAKEAVLGYQR